MTSSLLSLLKLIKLAKFSKVLFSSATIVITIFTYSISYGFPFAIGFVGLIFCHEMGHYMAARQRGIEVGLPTFIPFVGAWIDLKEKPISVKDEAYIAISGPFAGTIAAFVCYYYGRVYENNVAIALAHSGFFLNLFNLIPFHPLDGGRIVAILSPIFWFFGCPIMVVMWYFYESPMLLLIAIMGVPSLQKAWILLTNPPEEDEEYYKVPNEVKFEYAIIYLGLIIVLALMVYNIKL